MKQSNAYENLRFAGTLLWIIVSPRKSDPKVHFWVLLLFLQAHPRDCRQPHQGPQHHQYQGYHFLLGRLGVHAQAVSVRECAWQEGNWGTHPDGGRFKLIHSDFYSQVRPVTTELPLMFLTNTQKIFKARLRRLRKMKASDGSSDESEPTSSH